MVDRSLAQSPLAALHVNGRAAELPARADGAAARVILQERRFPTLLNLRADPADTTAMQAIDSALGGALPREPNTTSRCGAATVFWLGPDEWLVAAWPGGAALPQSLDAVARDWHVAVTDVSDARAVVRLSGPDARDVLEKGCTLDLHGSVFQPDDCAQTGLAQATVLLHRGADTAPDETAWDIYVERSFAGYLWMWLEDAAREFGLGIAPSD